MVNKAAARQRPAREQNASCAVGQGRRRERGRPKRLESENVRERLLSAARELFLRYGYRAVSSRQIGAAAGVNSAMIRYYFGGKPGLYREILTTILKPTHDRFERAGLVPTPLPQLIASMTGLWAGNPWLAGFVVREVLTPDGPMRALFSREIPERFVPIAERIVQGAIERGEVRSDLDPKLLVLSMVSLAIFPFLAYPLTSRLLGVSNDAYFVERFLRHTNELLLRGVGVGNQGAGRSSG
jgi:TetR/AcrR family transcriptional regulator